MEASRDQPCQTKKEARATPQRQGTTPTITEARSLWVKMTVSWVGRARGPPLRRYLRLACHRLARIGWTATESLKCNNHPRFQDRHRTLQYIIRRRPVILRQSIVRICSVICLKLRNRAKTLRHSQICFSRTFAWRRPPA